MYPPNWNEPKPSRPKGGRAGIGSPDRISFPDRGSEGLSHDQQCRQIPLQRQSPRPLPKAAPIEERHARGTSGKGCCNTVASGENRSPFSRRKLRSSPLREKITSISFAATIVGKMCTADLRGQDLPSDTAGWREELRTGAATARYVADELDKARERLQREAAVMTPKEFGEAYGQASPDIQQAISDKIRAVMAMSETSDFPVNLPVSALGQPVLNLATEHDR